MPFCKPLAKPMVLGFANSGMLGISDHSRFSLSVSRLNWTAELSSAAS